MFQISYCMSGFSVLQGSLCFCKALTHRAMFICLKGDHVSCLSDEGPVAGRERFICCYDRENLFFGRGRGFLIMFAE